MTAAQLYEEFIENEWTSCDIEDFLLSLDKYTCFAHNYLYNRHDSLEYDFDELDFMEYLKKEVSTK